MLQNDTTECQKPIKKNWRLIDPPPYEVDYLMRLGDISRQAARALIDKHGGDRSAINAELIARRCKRN
jgi:hypothetical protein